MDLSASILFPGQKWLSLFFFPSSSLHPSDTWGSIAITDDAPVTQMRDSVPLEHWIINDLLCFLSFSSFAPFFLSPSLAFFLPPSLPPFYSPARRLSWSFPPLWSQLLHVQIQTKFRHMFCQVRPASSTLSVS